MRSLLIDAPLPVLAVNTAPGRFEQLGERDEIAEVHLAARPTLGRLESTRAFRALGTLELATLRRFSRRLAKLAADPRAPAAGLHCLPHTIDFVAVTRVAEQLGLPMFLSIHDDLGYLLRGHPERSYALRRLGQTWRSAAARFVISAEMGDEMCRRYGELPYLVVTDGLESLAGAPRPMVAGRMAVYFMGAAHIAYAQNFQCLLDALARLRAEGVQARLVTRAGELPFALAPAGVPVESRPWAPQSELARDLDEIDVAYLPLPFAAEHRDFVRFSMSTKLVTYLGSGVPVLYHGPGDSAAANMLRRADAALLCDSLDPVALAGVLRSDGERRRQVADGALRVARESFAAATVRERFWLPIRAAAATP
jgi:hypothetical protein